MARRTTPHDEVASPSSVKGGDTPGGGPSTPSLDTWRTQGDTATLTSREQALKDVQADIAALGVTVVSDADTEAYLDYRAAQMGMKPEELFASTMGDTILIRASAVDDVRTLREELIHTQQQQPGMEISAESVTAGEVEARQLLLENANRWGLTEAERTEIREDLVKIEQRGGY